jgi:tight adherence protein B
MVESMSRDVRSGSSLRAAVTEALGQARAPWPEVRTALAAGLRLDEALATVEPSGDLALVAHALRVAAETGGATGDTLERTAAVLRERHAWRTERQAHSAHARLSARVLTVLQLVVCVWSLLSSARVRAAYSASSITTALACAGIVLNLAGWLWMRRLVRAGDSQ